MAVKVRSDQARRQAKQAPFRACHSGAARANAAPRLRSAIRDDGAVVPDRREGRPRPLQRRRVAARERDPLDPPCRCSCRDTQRGVADVDDGRRRHEHVEGALEGRLDDRPEPDAPDDEPPVVVVGRPVTDRGARDDAAAHSVSSPLGKTSGEAVMLTTVLATLPWT